MSEHTKEPLFLLNGARLKLSFQQEECESCGASSAHFRTVPMDQYAEELQGRWVALIAAENDRHLELARLEKQRDELLALAKLVRKDIVAFADDLKVCSTIGGEWDGSEHEAKEEYDRLMALAAKLEKAEADQ